MYAYAYLYNLCVQLYALRMLYIQYNISSTLLARIKGRDHIFTQNHTMGEGIRIQKL